MKKRRSIPYGSMSQVPVMAALLALLGPAIAQAAPLTVEAGVVVDAEARDTGEALQIEGALVDDRDEPLAGRPVALQVLGRRDRVLAVAEVVTDASGHFHKEFPHSPGARTLLVTSGRDALYADGRTRVSFVRTEPPKPAALTASALVVPGALDDSVRIRGRLTVAGVGRRARLSMSPGGSVDTDAAGRFDTELGGWRFPSRRAEVRLSFAGAADATRAAAAVSVLLPEPTPTPAWAYLGPLGLTLALLLGAWLRVWWKTPRPTRRRAPRRGPPPVLEADPSPPVPYALADQDGVAGVLVDRTDGEPLAGGRVSLLPGNRVALTDRHGRFRFDHVQPGRYVLLGEAPGHMPGEAPARFPHRGELSAVRLALTPVREAVRDVWREVATFREGVDPWPMRTPEEVAQGVMGDFAKLTELLEETWWSGRPADARRVHDAEALAGKAPPT